MSCFIYHWPSYVPLLLLQELQITSLQVSHMLKNNSFSLLNTAKTLQLDIFGYSSVSGLQTCHTLARNSLDCITTEKLKKIITSLSAGLSFAWIVSNAWCFHQGTINDNKIMSVDATQLCFYRNPTKCLLSMNKSARRCMFCNESVKHDKSVGLAHSRVKTDIEPIISLLENISKA